MRNFRAMTVTFCENIAVFFERFVSYREKFRKNYAWNRKTLAFFAKVKPLINSRKLLIINSYSFIRDAHVINFLAMNMSSVGLIYVGLRKYMITLVEFCLIIFILWRLCLFWSTLSMETHCKYSRMIPCFHAMRPQHPCYIKISTSL